ncbi:MAG: twin-arginine translocation signal domain-containing protein [Pseudomonadota bacterium]
MADITKDTQTDPNRRGFLTLAGLGATASGAALVTGETAEAATDVAADSDGYRETDHVRAYYTTARF